MRCDNYNQFYENEHGYVFNRNQLETLIYDVRKDAIQECIDLCANLADLTAPCPSDGEYKNVYVFAMDKIIELLHKDHPERNI